MTAGVGPSLAAERGTSWLHRLDPIVKLAWTLAVVVVAFATFDPVPLFAIAVLGLVVALTAGVGGRVARLLLIFAPVTASIIVVQTLSPAACAGPCAPTIAFGPLGLHPEGMLRGLSLAGRLLAVESVSLAVITTTHASDWSAAFTSLRVPYLANLMLTMTLQLVPILQREFEIVLAAQRSRGMPSRGFRAVMPSFVPVFAGAFERVRQLTIGLESRGFGAAGRRTSYRRLRFGPFEAGATLAAIGAAVVGTIAGLTVWSAARTTDVLLPPGFVTVTFAVAGTLFVGVIAAGIRSLART